MDEAWLHFWELSCRPSFFLIIMAQVVFPCCRGRLSRMSPLALRLSPQLCGYTERKPLSLQVFVGTADDRSIRPHPFYQIHRYWLCHQQNTGLRRWDSCIKHLLSLEACWVWAVSLCRVTGKMVGTASHESVQAGTKLLDIPLNPENNMTALWVQTHISLSSIGVNVCHYILYRINNVEKVFTFYINKYV